MAFRTNLAEHIYHIIILLCLMGACGLWRLYGPKSTMKQQQELDHYWWWDVHYYLPPYVGGELSECDT